MSSYTGATVDWAPLLPWLILAAVVFLTGCGVFVAAYLHELRRLPNTPPATSALPSTQHPRKDPE